MQKDRIQTWKNTKGQNTNVTKYKKTIYKYDKTQNDRTQKRQYTIQQNTNMTKHKCDKMQIFASETI